MTEPAPVTLTIETADRALARAIAGAWENLVEPSPDALSVFDETAASAMTAGRLPDAAAAPLWRIDATYQDPPDAAAIAATLEAILETEIPPIATAEVPDLNWVAISQAALPPVEAGRFVVHGSHDRARVGGRLTAIEIEAGEAFGTAHHATTYGCLLAIDRLSHTAALKRPVKVLDLGCGSGVLAIALAKAWPESGPGTARLAGPIVASDIDAQSCIVARENAAHNGVARGVRVVHADGAAAPELRGAAPFDVVIANILAGPLVVIAKDIARIMRPGGTLILSGILVPQAHQVIAAYRAAGFALCDHRRIAGWSTLRLTRRA